ncbi:hypothetical protein QSH18_17575 [Xanthomonas sp. NCPPB 2654]|uniref:DUF6882 domain-containing protein n=1 Tax=unclassified Xanthomonas TaxID=2643310 RepID=UPI0021E06FCE|nr:MULTISPECIES: DUF6882 domain-containing protein [unclassified Xanthomonas]MDL5367423.1 hypothetical protein [Xanthomonas sp. NCPPB 2654]UYC20661.1 hypothetical protein NUG20_21470 [Xanthomonas sp. CFBP 8443]
MTPSFQALLARHIGTAFARQMALADVLGERGWRLDLAEGIAHFDDDLHFPVQLLGSAAEDSASWLWAWANTASNLPENLLVAANALREIGEREGPAELATASLPLDDDGHTLALLAAALSVQCYYRGPYRGGALFFLLDDVPASVFAPCDDARVLSLLGQLVAQFPLDHRAMTEGFLDDQEYALQRESGQTVATRGGSRITLAFDALGRLAQVQGSLAPQQATTVAAADKPAPKWQFWKK